MGLVGEEQTRSLGDSGDSDGGGDRFRGIAKPRRRRRELPRRKIADGTPEAFAEDADGGFVGFEVDRADDGEIFGIDVGFGEGALGEFDEFVRRASSSASRAERDSSRTIESSPLVSPSEDARRDEFRVGRRRREAIGLFAAIRHRRR